MKQVIQDFRNGSIQLLDVPKPVPQPGMVLVRNAFSLISTGTERAGNDFARKNLLSKAKARPDLVAQVRRKLQKDGLKRTLQTVRSKMSFPQALGYSCAGQVEALGEDVEGLTPGQWVACAGAGYAAHADYVLVPRNLVVATPEGVKPEQAAFVTLGAIALQGVRVAEPILGETIAVIGLGLLGLLTVQLLKANGVNVVGVDLDPAKVDLAKSLGARSGVPRGEVDAEALMGKFTGGRGFDRVIVTASTKSDDPMSLASQIIRRKGVICLVGDVGLNLDRRPLYFQEAEIRLSMSYGPGRYDRSYEEGGLDYPYEYVRWTENRNMEAFLDLIAQGAVKVDPLANHRFPITEVEAAYQLLQEGDKDLFGILLDYQGQEPEKSPTIDLKPSWQPKDGVRLGVIGCGEFARGTLLPALEQAGGKIQAMASAQGLSARVAGEAFKAARVTSDPEALLAAEDVDGVLVLTRHDSHAQWVEKTLAQGKACFVEKPLALTENELDQVGKAWLEAGKPPLLTGFNRRYSPMIQEICKGLPDVRVPRMINLRVQGGRIPTSHWVQDVLVGGGRLVGEVCHFLDLARWLAASPLKRVFASTLGRFHADVPEQDNLAVHMEFANGSVANIHYGTEGGGALPKEWVEVSAGGRTYQINDYRSGLMIDDSGKNKLKGGDGKGHLQELQGFLKWAQTGEACEPPGLCLHTGRYPFLVHQSLREGVPVEASSEDL